MSMQIPYRSFFLRSVFSVLIFSACFTANIVFADTQTTSMGVSAQVVNDCSLSTSDMLFGVYNPITTNSSSPLNQTASISISCTKGSSVRIDINNGANYANGSRNMLGPSSAILQYNLYQDPQRTIAWGSGAGSGYSFTSQSMAQVNLTVYGSIPANQDVVAGNYTDTVTVTANY